MRRCIAPITLSEWIATTFSMSISATEPCARPRSSESTRRKAASCSIRSSRPDGNRAWPRCLPTAKKSWWHAGKRAATISPAARAGSRCGWRGTARMIRTIPTTTLGSTSTSRVAASDAIARFTVGRRGCTKTWRYSTRWFATMTRVGSRAKGTTSHRCTHCASATAYRT